MVPTASRCVLMPYSGSPTFLIVDMLGARYKPGNFGAEKGPGSQDGRA